MAEKLEGKEGSLSITQNMRGGVSINYVTEVFQIRLNELRSEYDLDDVRILETLQEGGEVETATSIILGIIQSNPDIIAAFGTSGISSLSWPGAAEKAGKQPGDMVIITEDITEENVEKYNEGWVDMLVGVPLYDEGYKCAENFHKLFNGEDVPEFEHIDAEYLTEETEGELIPKYEELFARVKDDSLFAPYRR